jgi:hypothetical protein
VGLLINIYSIHVDIKKFTNVQEIGSFNRFDNYNERPNRDAAD